MTYLDTVWSMIDFSDPKPAGKALQEADKGACPKCGKHIGKGVHFHVRSCDGDPAKAV